MTSSVRHPHVIFCFSLLVEFPGGLLGRMSAYWMALCYRQSVAQTDSHHHYHRSGRAWIKNTCAYENAQCKYTREVHRNERLLPAGSQTVSHMAGTDNRQRWSRQAIKATLNTDRSLAGFPAPRKAPGIVTIICSKTLQGPTGAFSNTWLRRFFVQCCEAKTEAAPVRRLKKESQ